MTERLALLAASPLLAGAALAVGSVLVGCLMVAAARGLLRRVALDLLAWWQPRVALARVAAAAVWRALRERLVLVAVVPLMVGGNLLAWVRFSWALVFSPSRAWRIAVGVDQLTNVSANGSEDETVSSRAGRARLEGRRWACVLCRVIDTFDPGHCERSIGI